MFDYCQRSLLQLSSGDVIPQFPTKDINNTGKYIMFMSLLENSAGKPVDLVRMEMGIIGIFFGQFGKIFELFVT